MTVSNSSRLMRVLLPPEVYKKKYGNAADKIIAEYDHENDKFRVLSNSGIDSDSQDSYLNSWREDYYRMLNGIGADSAYRFDVVGIDGELVTWVRNAFP